MSNAKADTSPPGSERLFLPSLRGALVLCAVGLAVLGVALLLRYEIIQNTPIGLACEAGEASLTCKIRLATILLFVSNVFGVTALVAAIVQLARPNMAAFGIGLVFAAAGLVLYNTRLSALAVALLVFSLARAVPLSRR
jgi:hypothetical protein